MNRLFLVVAIVLTFAVPPVLSAQTSPPDLTVVVTADRVLTDILSTAAHVSIITAEDIRESGATNVVELLDRQPGVSFRSFSNEAQATVDMRGFGEGSQGRVLVLLDGRRQNNPDMSGINWLGIPVDSIERIEVVRGSASALYGNHAVGGVINIITKTPTAPLQVTAFGSFGSFLTNQERLGILHAGERYRLRASGEHYSTDGHRDRSAYRALNFSLGSEFDLGRRLSLSLGGRYANIFYELPGGLTKEEFKDDPSQATNDADEGTENQFGIDADLSWSLGDRATTELALGYGLKSVEADYVSFPSFTTTDLHTVAASPAAVIDWELGAVPARTRVGVDWSWARQDGVSYDSVDRDTRFNEFQLGQSSIGVSLSQRLSITERFDAGGSVRYERSEISADQDEEDNPGATSDLSESVTHQAVVFEVDALFRPNDSTKLYASGGTLFRYPFLDEHYSYGSQFGPATFNKELNPEQGFSLEVGAGVFLGRVLEVELSAYMLQMRNEIAPNEFWVNENLDETRRIGGDLQISSEPIDLLRVAAGYSYVNAVFISGDDKDNQVPLVPNHSVDAEVGVRPLRGLEFGPAVTFRSEAYRGGDTANVQDKVDSYFLTDLFLRFRPQGIPGDLSLSAEVKNVFDASYAPFVNFGAYYPAPGRSFRVSAAYSY